MRPLKTALIMRANDMGTLKLAENFVSINGEGRYAGELALFMRFAGCNLQCDWCDTKWANGADAPFTEKQQYSLQRSQRMQQTDTVCTASPSRAGSRFYRRI